MKTASLILKILAAAAAVVGVVYLVATYGDKIVGWFKSLLGKCPCQCDCDECDCDGDCETCECECCECDCDGECDCEEPVEIAEEEVVAAEADFEE